MWRVLFSLLFVLNNLLPIGNESATGRAFPATGAVVSAPPPPALGALETGITQAEQGIETFQADFHAANGEYLQTLQSHVDVPTAGNAIAPDNLDAAPSDYPVPAEALWSGAGLPGATDYAVSVDIYSGPQGSGFVAVYCTVSGALYCMARNTGPETWRSHPWQEARPVP